VTVSTVAQPGTSADALDAEAFDLEARAAALHAEAARRRASQDAPSAWVRADSLPIAKSAALAACRSGALPATKKGRVWLVRRVDADAFLARTTVAPFATVSSDDAVRARLGLVRRAS
jgi:hypothetical protein